MTTPLRKTVERYLHLCSQTLRPSSVKGKRTDLQSLTLFLRQHYPCVRSWDQVQRYPHIERWLNHLHDSPLKPNTRITRIGALRRFFDDMFDWQWPEAPPPNLILQTDLPPKEYHLPKPLPRDVDQALTDALKRAPSLRTMGLLLLRQTGMRLGELIDLDVNALDNRDPDFSLHVPLGKTRTEHVIPVSAETAHRRDIMDIIITTIETRHRDSADTSLASPLARFVKRLRRTRDDLTRLLPKNTH